MQQTPPDDERPPKTVVVFGAGRSGTTWLAEAIAAAGLELVFEPLNPQEVPECREWQPLPLFYRRTDDFPWQDVFAAMLRGEIRNAWTERGSYRGERKVVELIRANSMIDWILEHFDIHPVFIIREPPLGRRVVASAGMGSVAGAGQGAAGRSEVFAVL